MCLYVVLLSHSFRTDLKTPYKWFLISMTFVVMRRLTTPFFPVATSRFSVITYTM